MTSTAATRISHDQQPGISDMDEHQRDNHLRTACRAAGQEWHATSEAAHRPSPEDLDAACQRARDAALAALTGAGLDGDEALAFAERAAQGQDDESGVQAHSAENHASKYPVPVGTISWHLLADGYTITWAPAPAGCSLTLDRHGPDGEHAAYRGEGSTMQWAWDEVRAQLGHGEPHAAASSTRQAPRSPRGSDRLYRVVQHYDSWPFGNDSRVPHGSKSHKRTDTFRTLGPVRQRLARANGHARYQRQHGGDWSGFVAMAEQLTDEGWQPIDVELAGMSNEQAVEPRGPEVTAGAPEEATDGQESRKDDGAMTSWQPGDRVALVWTGDPDTRLRPGDQGTITRWDPGQGQLHIRWDSGSSLSMLPGEGDQVRVLAPAADGDDGTGPGDPPAAKAAELGRHAGKAAATGVFDGNTPGEA